MTMATLSEKPITTTCILPLPTLPQPRLVSTESIALIRTTSTTSTTSFLCQPAALRDSPMTVPMTAASSGVDDDDRPQSDSSPALMKEDPTALTKPFFKNGMHFIASLLTPIITNATLNCTMKLQPSMPPLTTRSLTPRATTNHQ